MMERCRGWNDDTIKIDPSEIGYRWTQHLCTVKPLEWDASVRLFEFGDLDWVPDWYHVNLRKYLIFFYKAFGYFKLWIPSTVEFLDRSKSDTFLELGSGGGEPLALVVSEIPADKVAGKRFILSDINPVQEFVDRTNSQTESPFKYHPEAVDATAIPAELAHPRIFINSFHHFTPEQVVQVVASSVAQKQPMLVLEYVRNTPTGYLSMLTGPLVLILTVPFVVSRKDLLPLLLFTYLIPIFPLMFFWDGIVSCARMYSPQALQRIVADSGAQAEVTGYVKRSLLYPAGVTAVHIWPKN